MFDKVGNYKLDGEDLIDVQFSDLILLKHNTHYTHNNAMTKEAIPNYKRLQPYLLHVNIEIIRNILYATTQFGRTNTNPLQVRQDGNSLRELSNASILSKGSSIRPKLNHHQIIRQQLFNLESKF